VALRTFLCSVGLAILLWSPVSRGSDSIGTLLQRAEQVRSSNPKEYQRILATLNAEVSQGTQLQRQQIAYLNAYAMTFAGNLDGSNREARKIIETTQNVNLKFRAGALIVNNYALNGHYNEGLRQLEQTLALVDRIDDPELREHGLISAALLYNQIGQYQLGTRFADRVLALPSSPRAICFASYLKFDGLQKLGTLPQQDAPLQQAISTCDDHHETVMANLVRVTLARKWVAENRRNQAIDLLQSHLQEAQATGYPRLISEVRSLLATLLFEKGDIAGAKENALATANQSAGIENTPPVVSAFLTLYEIADRNGDLAEALKAYKRYAEAERGYLGEVKARELAYHLVRQEEQYKNQQIELLNRKNNLLQLQQQVDQQSAQNARLYMLLFALLAATIGYWAYKTKRMQMSVKRMAETDALTGICNRHHYTLQAEKTLGRCKAAGEPVSLLMFDLDYFKSINDSYGHVTGDWVLKRVAEVCADLCRGIDHLGRIGGEEFAILLHGCDLKAATRMAEDCRVRLSRIDPLPSGYTFPITASFGVSSSATSGYDLDKLLSHADQMLYRAKREGRNRVRAYVPETSAELTGVNFGKDKRQPADPGEISLQDSLRA
jgi:diguanylate cyclase (GGDEF)-like protein